MSAARTTTCRDCRFWKRLQDYPGEGECQLASEDMRPGDGREPGLRVVMEEYGGREASMWGSTAEARVLTDPGFSCRDAEPAGKPAPSAQQSASIAGRTCTWTSSGGVQRLYECPDKNGTLIWPECQPCPFRERAALRTPVTNGEGEEISRTEQDYLQSLRTRDLLQAQAHLEDALMLDNELTALHGKDNG